MCVRAFILYISYPFDSVGLYRKYFDKNSSSLLIRWCSMYTVNFNLKWVIEHTHTHTATYATYKCSIIWNFKYIYITLSRNILINQNVTASIASNVDSNRSLHTASPISILMIILRCSALFFSRNLCRSLTNSFFFFIRELHNIIVLLLDDDDDS